MCPISPLCGGVTTAALTLMVISYGFPRCPVALNLNFAILVLLSFALVISKHLSPTPGPPYCLLTNH